MILLMNHADVNPRDLKGNTPLHFACNNGHMDSAALLLIHGADVTVCNDRGDTPLHNAARWNHSILVRELILYGALYSCKNNEDKTPSELTTDEEVLDIIRSAMKGEISVGEYANNRMDHTHADSPGISDDETFEHV
jgi:ankyrin repeat protein